MKTLFAILTLALLPITSHAGRPQEPKKPYPYIEQEVTFENKKDVVTLAGTLTLPKSKGPHPAVLLITGSGPQDRDETIVGHKPFAVLADYLVRQGIAVLRFDDRGVDKSAGVYSMCTSEDFATDALAGVEFLKGRKEIDSHKIGLIGHSEGGIIASMVAVRSSDVAFIVLMASPGVTGEQIILKQQELAMKARGASEQDIAWIHARQNRIYEVLKEELDRDAAEQKLRAILLEGAPKELTDSQEFAVSSEVQSALALLPWLRFFLTYDPAPTLAKVTYPVLAINGEKDCQVSSRQNLPAIRKALRSGGNKDFSIIQLPGLNHLFQRCENGSVDEYAKIEETISPTALEVIGNWIAKHTAPPR